MSALEDAKVVLRDGGIMEDGRYLDYRDALAALVTECEMWEAVARLGTPVPSTEVVVRRHGDTGGRLPSEKEIRKAEKQRGRM